MKNLITFLLYCLSVTAMIGQGLSQSRLTVSSESITETTIKLSLTGVNRIPVTTALGAASIIQIDRGTPLLETGKPDLPKIATSLMIPATGNMEVEIVGSEFQDFNDVDIAPSKGNLLRNIDPAKIPYKYGEQYQTDAFFPGLLADLKEPFVMRDVRGQSLWLYPVQYNPVTKVMRVYTSLSLRVHHVGGTGLNEHPRNSDKSPSPSFLQLYQKLFSNFNPSFIADGNRSVIVPEQMLIIAKDEFISGLGAYVSWKRKMGIQTTVVPVSETGASPADLYNYVSNYYASHRITYLLLVGDEYAIAPMVRPGSDYSCDNCLGYQEGNDHFPEIFVGRFHASNQAQLAIMVNRNLEYERNPLVDETNNWCATGMASSSDQGQGIGDDGQADYEQGNEWKAKHLADGYEKYWEFYEGDHADISPTPGSETADAPGNPVSSDLTTLMNGRGVSLYNYCGHGWEQGLVSGNFDVTAVGTLRNVHRYPIVIAVACCAGNFTNNGGGDCLGEALQRAGDPATGTAWGGIAGFFSSDFQSWAPPMEGQDGMNQYLVDADGVTLRPNLGAMAAFGNALMIAAYAQGGIDMADVWNPFLDPSTMPRTDLPKQLTATHSPNFAPGITSIVVNCPVEGALVSLFQDGQVIAVAKVESGIALLQFPALTSISDISVTATQFNYIPYQGVIKVATIQNAYVVSQAFSINDAALGNNNQQADFGEMVGLNLALSNVGQAIANATQATLSTTDDRVSIIDGTESFGDISANNFVEIPAAFQFKVADDVPDGYVLIFNLHVVFNNTQSIDIPLPVTLNAPKLEIGTFTLSDNAPNGDGDKRLESNEKATVIVKNFNFGHSNSANALGALTTNSPWLTISNPIQLGPIDALSGTADAAFIVTVAGNAPQVTTANLSYTVTAGNYSAVKNLGTFIINPIVEDFESHTFTSYPWLMSGNKPWVISSGGAYTGNYCSRSGSIGANQISRMDLTLDFSADGNVSFARKVSSEEGYDFLRFLIDDVEIASWSGTIAWGEVSFPINTGVHKLSWIYAKDEVGNSGSDRAWVDEILLPPYQVVVATHTPSSADFDVSITPNPAGNKTWLAVNFPTSQQVEIDLYDCTGRKARSYTATGTLLSGSYKLELDLKGLTPGMYFLNVRSAQTSRTLKLVKGSSE
ncbi:MAG: C25 family cysteine peptidase [Bacteroidota bacterium]